MDEIEIPVYPNINRIMKICKAKFRIIDLKLNNSVRIAVYLYNEYDLFIEATQFLIEGEEYAEWSNDDTYLIKLVKQKISANIK
jgi:hypothetical protein